MSKKHVLPIDRYDEIIVDTIDKNDVIIIDASTGAGKSTQVPQFLLKAGYKLLVTQPRVLAAISLANRVAEELGLKVGNEIGYRTSDKKLFNKDTRCIFCTDGLALITELMSQNKYDILIIDEVHEFNLNIEILIAWYKEKLLNGINVKLILMSATLDVKKLSVYFNNAPIISVPGKLFPIEHIKADYSSTPELEAVKIVNQGKDILIFQPGKKEISDCINKLEELLKDVGVKIFPLHSEIDYEDQKKCFESYSVPKIVVATNIAQTSITIDGIYCVIDTASEKVIINRNGIDQLVIQDISLNDAKQRKGRAGRTGPGMYIDFCLEKDEDRLEYSQPEILRKRIDQTILMLGSIGFGMEDLTFFHQPDIETIHNTKLDLIELGFLNKDNTLTDLGRDATLLSLDTRYSKMILEAIDLGVLDDVITIVCILSEGEITERGSKRKPASRLWKYEFCRDEESSDLLAQLAVYNNIINLNLTKEEMKEYGINRKNFFNVKNARYKLVEFLKDKVDIESDGNRENIIKCITMGLINNVYYKNYSGDCYGKTELYPRKLNNSTVLNLYRASFLVGLPMNIQFKDKYDFINEMALVSLATIISLEEIIEINPNIITIEYIDPFFSQYYDEVRVDKVIKLYGKVVKMENRISITKEEYNKLIQNNKELVI